MKAIISSTYDDTYLFYLPITTWLWNKLEVDVICFMPSHRPHETEDGRNKLRLALKSVNDIGIRPKIHFFRCPVHKEATYAQCSRLYAAALDLPEYEILITSDVDMGVFKLPPISDNGFSIFGTDLVPIGQYPMCYASAPVKDWRSAMNIGNRSHQQCLDDLLGADDCEHYKANRWSVDQEQLHLKISGQFPTEFPRSNGQNQFAQNRIDRDDSFWEERLTPDIIDAHLWRPGYEGNNFNNILELLNFFYPEENFNWLVEYRNSYVNLHQIGV